MSYSIEQSPLYGVTSIHRLAEVLKIRVGRLRSLDYLTAQFKEGTVERNGKERKTETPIRSMRRLHNRVQALLTRIETPDYLHSGKRKRSYLSNAAAHAGNEQSFHVDISKFYPSCTWHHVYLCFLEQFQCDSDISGIMATLLTYKGHIPTGSPNSSLLSFFVQRELFDKLYELGKRSDLTMTVLQDDVSFSGARIVEPIRAEIRRTIKRHDLVPKRSKQKFYHGGRPPEITGIVQTRSGSKAPWRRHLALRTAIDEFESASEEKEIRTAYQRAMGRLSEIERVQGRLFDLKSRLKAQYRERMNSSC